MKIDFSFTIVPNNNIDYNIFKKELIDKIINISNLTDNYKNYIKIIINKSLNIIFINFLNKILIENFCKNFKGYDKINVNDFFFEVKPNYKYFSKIVINKTTEMDKEKLIYYIKEKQYIDYYFYVEEQDSFYNLYFSSESNAKEFIEDNHKTNMKILKYILIKNILSQPNLIENKINEPLKTPIPNELNINNCEKDNIQVCKNASEYFYDIAKQVTSDIELYINNKIYLDKDYKNIDKYNNIVLNSQEILSEIYKLKMELFKLSIN